MSTVRWLPYVWKQPRPADPRELEQFEQKWGVKLPEQYKQIASAYQGMGVALLERRDSDVITGA